MLTAVIAGKARWIAAVRQFGNVPNRREHYKYWVSLQSRWKDNDMYGHINNAEVIIICVDSYLSLICNILVSITPILILL